VRVGVVAIACALCACADRAGTYLVVDGGKSGISFDHVEFFIGKAHGNATPFTPDRPYVPNVEPAGETQRLIKRLFVGSDIQLTSETKMLSYYLAPGEANPFLRYALAVASRDGEVVGLGEVEFHVYDEGAYLYKMALVPVSGFERWGTPDLMPGDSCVRWTRTRNKDAAESTVVVSREDDRDCDGLTELIECDDLNYCPDTGATACARRNTACIAPDSCDLGTCVDGLRVGDRPKSCTATTCLPEAFCVRGDECVEDGPADAFLSCAIEIGLEHTEVTMPVTSVGGELCEKTYEVEAPLGLECLFPEIVYPPLGKVSAEWTFKVMQTPNQPGSCTFTLIGDPGDADAPTTHLVVSVLIASSMGRRTSFVVGFAPHSTATGTCMETVDIKAQPTSSPNPTCPSPLPPPP
jgi:hypothetical protein